MQALVLADMKQPGLKSLSENNPTCMISICGFLIIEKMLKQLDEDRSISRIVLVVGDHKKELIDFVLQMKLNTEVVFVENDLYQESGTLYSVFRAREYLSMEDTIIMNSQLIMEKCLLEKALKKNKNNIVFVDSYKDWMTGEFASISQDGNIFSFDKKIVEKLDGAYKVLGICKFNVDFIRKYYIPAMEMMISVLGTRLTYIAPLSAIVISDAVKIKAEYAGGASWREINTIEDVNQSEVIFSEDEKTMIDRMLGSWGGYWRYPDYLDYFYLVTPYYPPSELINELKNNFCTLLEQYPSGMRVNANLAASAFGVSVKNIIIGNGAAELIKSVMSCVKGKTGFIRPTFEEYPNRYDQMEAINYVVESDEFSYSADDVIGYFEDTDISNLVLVNPDNPSGNYIAKKDILRMASWAQKRNVKMIVDESFVDFSDEPNSSLIDQDIINQYTNLYIIKSISKSYGVPGLRLGILVSGDVNLIEWMKKDVSIWNINSFAEYYMQISGKYRNEYDRSLDKFRKERKRFESKLRKINGVRVIPSQANYFMVELLNGLDAEELKNKMLIEKKVFIKTLGKKIKGRKQYLRIAIRNEKDNDSFIERLTETINEMQGLKNRD